MTPYTIAPRAVRDLQEIWAYIAVDNEVAAASVLEAIRNRFELLGANPKVGRSREDLGQDLRAFPVGQYLIVYRLRRQRVRILRVIHGRRDLPALFRH